MQNVAPGGKDKNHHLMAMSCVTAVSATCTLPLVIRAATR